MIDLFLHAAMLMTTPILLTAIGGMVNRIGGLVNIGLESMMLAGALAAVSSEFGTELVRLERECFELAGHPFNLNSPNQLRDILFTELKLSAKGLKKTKSGFSTDADTLDIARMVLVGKVNRDIVSAINVHGALAVGLSGEDANLLTAVARSGELGFVGDIEGVDPSLIERLLAQGLIPVVATIAADVAALD